MSGSRINLQFRSILFPLQKNPGRNCCQHPINVSVTQSKPPTSWADWRIVWIQNGPSRKSNFAFEFSPFEKKFIYHHVGRDDLQTWRREGRPGANFKSEVDRKDCFNSSNSIHHGAYWALDIKDFRGTQIRAKLEAFSFSFLTFSRSKCFFTELHTMKKSK